MTRYDDLLAKIPKGSFYDAAWSVLPHRSGNYSFLFEPVTASRTFRVLVNNQDRGFTTSNASGQAIVSATLLPGRNDIVIVDTIDQSRFIAGAHTKRAATVLAATASQLEIIDDYLDATRLSYGIDAADTRLIEDVHGAQVKQPNDIGSWLLDAYRGLVKILRQGYRIFGSKLRGIRQNVLAFTSAVPLRTPRAWRPWWRLGYQLAPNGDLQERARLLTDQQQLNFLPGLNVVALAWVHAAYPGSSTNVFPGPFRNPPTPQRLYLTFAAGWNGGSVTFIGEDRLGSLVTEVFTPINAQPLAALERVEGTIEFAVATSATKTSVGAAAAVTSGLRDSRFVKVTSVSPDQPVAGSVELRYLQNAGHDILRWETSVFSQVNIDVSGSYVVSNSQNIQPDFVGLALESGAGFTVNERRYLLIEMDNRGPVLVNLGANTITAANAAIEVNEFFGRDPRYGANPASGTIQNIAGSLLADTETVTIDDGDNPAVIFEWDSGAGVGAGNVAVPFTGADTSTVTALSLANAINSVGGPPLNVVGPAAPRLRIRAYINVSVPSIVELRNHFGGTVGNIAITETVANAGFVVSGMSGGTNSPYNVISSVATDGASANLALRIRGTAGTAATNIGTGYDSNVKIWPVGADANVSVLGLPRYSTTLDASAVFLAQTLDTSVGAAPFADRIPLPAQNILLSAAFADTTTSAAATLQPTRPQALEVIFDGGWRGGSMRIDGADYAGAAFSEVFSNPNTNNDNIVRTGTLTATSGDTGITIIITSDNLSAIEVGHYFRVTSGAQLGQGAFIQRIVRDVAGVTPRIGVTLQGAGIGANFTSQSYSITKSVTRKGTDAFASISAIVNLTPQSAGDNGNCLVSIINGQTHCIPLIIGRGSQQSTGVGGGTVLLDTSGGAGGTVLRLTAAAVTSPADLGGWVQIVGAVASGGSNCGLHPITDSIAFNPAVFADYVFLIRHQDEGVFMGEFVTESPLPGGVTWYVYSGGARVYAADVNRTTGIITMFPPGLLSPMATASRVELNGELPFRSSGRDVGRGYVVVDVDKTFLPTTQPILENSAVVGQNTPDGWIVTNATVDALTWQGYFGGRLAPLTNNGGGDTSIQVACPEAATYKGFDVRIDAWVAQHVSASEDLRIDVDFGFGFSNGANQAVARTIFDPASSPTLDPTMITRTVEVPYNATLFTVRLTHVGAANTEVVTIEKIHVIATFSTASFLGENTVPYTNHEAKFGELLYVFSPENLVERERQAIGLPASTYQDGDRSDAPSPRQAHIDQTANAHGRWARYDMSEYTGLNSTPVNVLGAYDDIGWAAATLTNMEVVVGTPPRTSYITPSRVSLVDNELLAVTAPSNATLSLLYTHAVPFPSESFTDEVLLEFPVSGLYPDGLTVPATASITGGVLPWRFIAANAVQIASVAAGDPGAQAVYQATSTYRLTYRTLLQAEAEIIDLGGSFADYNWYVDAAIYQRKQPSSTTYKRTQDLTFLANFRAALTTPAETTDRTGDTLVRDDGLVQTTLDSSVWRFIDESTVELNSAAFSADALYSLTYDALEPKYTSPTTAIIEARSAATSGAVPSATYETVAVDTLVNRSNQFHQLRVTVQGVVDVRDIRIYGLGLRGARFHGASPAAPGILIP